MNKVKQKNTEVAKINFPFGKQNYILLIIAAVVVIIGFLLMVGGKAEDPSIFNEDEIFSFRRITLAPIVVMSGYIIAIVAIMRKKD